MSDTPGRETLRIERDADGLERDQNDTVEQNESHHSQFEQSSHDTDDNPRTLQPVDDNGSRTLLLNVQPPLIQPTLNIQNVHGSQAQENQDTSLRQTTPSSIVATLDGRVVGRIYLKYNADLTYILNPPTVTLHIPTTLVLDANRSQLVPNDSSNLQALVHSAPPNKRSIPTSSATPPRKRLKTVDENASPVAVKPAFHYSKAIEEPEGMTKHADDSCLTCLKHNRKCKGTDIKLVKNRKRCEACAKPGKNTSGRVCYWKTPSRGVYTYEDAQEKLSKDFGGRVLQKNTRAGRLERQQRAALQTSQEVSPETGEADLDGDSDANNTGYDGDVDVDTMMNDDNSGDGTSQEEIDRDLGSAIESAYLSLYAVIVQDLGLSDDSNSTSTRLTAERAIRDALTGSGAHQARLDGIDERVLQGICTKVSDDIKLLEKGLENQQSSEQEKGQGKE